MAALVVVAIPLLFVSRIPEQNTDLSGKESMIEVAEFVIFAPLTAWAVVEFRAWKRKPAGTNLHRPAY